MNKKEDAINFIKSYRKIDERLHEIAPKNSIAYQAASKCLDYWNMAIKALEQESSSDTISRKKLIKDLNFLYEDGYIKDARAKKTMEVIMGQASVNPQEPKIGHWTKVTDKTGYLTWECDKCSWQQKYTTNFCPNCGVKMISYSEDGVFRL